MGRIRRFAALVLLSLLVLTSFATTGGVRAQDASPAAGSADCVAPELPPGTPTPEEELATPVATDPDYPRPLDAGTTPDDATAERAIAAMENVVACVGAGDFTNIGTLMSDSFVRNFIELPSRYDVAANLEGAGAFEVHLLDDVLVHGDGRLSVRFVYSGFFNGPDSYTAERWVFVDDGGTLLVDDIAAAQIPDGLFPDAVVVEVTMVDYAYLVEPRIIPAGEMVILRATTQEGAAEEGHEAALLQLPGDVTAQELIQSENLEELEADATFFAHVYAQPGQTADAGVAGLEPGTYFLLCYVSTEDGTPHAHLGMVAEITVE